MAPKSLLLLAALCLSACIANASNGPCDDQMSDDPGANLKRIQLPTPRQPTPPAAQSWVAPLVSVAVRKQLDVTSVFKFSGKKVSSCKVTGYEFGKLCVPLTGKPGNFRAKVLLHATCNTSKGPADYEMNVKMRISVSSNGKKGVLALWGRSAS